MTRYSEAAIAQILARSGYGIDQRGADAASREARTVVSSGRPSAAAPDAQASLLELRQLWFLLPMPPTVNELYRHPDVGQLARGVNPHFRFLTDEQKAFRRAAGESIRLSMKSAPALTGRIEMTLTLMFADRRRTDISNRIKAVEDALTHAKAWHDDSQVDRLIVERTYINGQGACSVLLREIAG